MREAIRAAGSPLSRSRYRDGGGAAARSRRPRELIAATSENVSRFTSRIKRDVRSDRSAADLDILHPISLPLLFSPCLCLFLAEC